MTRLIHLLYATIAIPAAAWAPVAPSRPTMALFASTTKTYSFIDTELRGAAMKLHTRQQAPVEGQQETVERKPYTPTVSDYLNFLVASQVVFQALEDVVNDRDELQVLRNTGLERTVGLEQDIEYLCTQFDLERPLLTVNYATQIVGELSTSIPAFMCHYYNFYFAHTAGGRMIGKQMSKLLLDGRTLEFYKWDGDLETMKATVKQSIEDMAAQWTDEQKQECVDQTKMAFQGGGSVNAFLAGGR